MVRTRGKIVLLVATIGTFLVFTILPVSRGESVIDSIVGAFFIAITLPIAFLIEWAYSKEEILEWYPKVLAMFSLFPVLILITQNILPQLSAWVVILPFLVHLLLGVIWVTSLDAGKNIFQTVWFPHVISRYNKGFFFFSVVAILVYFASESFIDNPLRNVLINAAAIYSFLWLSGTFITPSNEKRRLWKYCKMSLKVVKSSIQTGKSESTRRLSNLKSDISIFKAVIKHANTLSGYFYNNHPRVRDVDYYHTALFTSNVGGNEAWRKRAIQAIDVMLKAFNRKNSEITFDFYQFVRGLNVLVGKRSTFSNIISSVETKKGINVWLEKNSKLIEVGLAIVVTVVAIKELLPFVVEFIKKLLGLL